MCGNAAGQPLIIFDSNNVRTRNEVHITMYGTGEKRWTNTDLLSVIES